MFINQMNKLKVKTKKRDVEQVLYQTSRVHYQATAALITDSEQIKYHEDKNIFFRLNRIFYARVLRVKFRADGTNSFSVS